MMRSYESLRFEVNFLSRTKTTKWQSYLRLSHIQVPLKPNSQSILMHHLQCSSVCTCLAHVIQSMCWIESKASLGHSCIF
ncbi:hypothetical protein JHK86_056641 [Glycine max]|nr:hypothetical protein JHK86_056641 [Glycine max]